MITLKSFYSSSSGNLYTATSGEHTLLIEAGVPIKKIMQALDFKLCDIDGCLCTHSHRDHCQGLQGVMEYSVDCYATAETFKDLAGHRAHVIEPKKQFKVAGYWTIMPLPTEHDAPGSVAFLISDGEEKLLFLTDSFYFRYDIPGLNVIAIEANYSKEAIDPDLDPSRRKRLVTSHFSLENVLKFLGDTDLSKCRHLFLLHLSSANSDAVLFRSEVMASTGIPTTVCDK